MERTARGVTYTGLVYSDIEAPKDKLFAVVYGKEAAVTAFDDTTLDAETTETNWKKANIPAANPYSGGAEQGTIGGTYDGVAGIFTCNDGCPKNADFPERRQDGTVIYDETEDTDHADFNGRWTFKPTVEAAMVKVPHADFLTYGFWLSTTTADGPVGFGVWYDGSAKKIASIEEIHELDEKVKYTGSAAGKYVTKNEVLNTAKAGYFTADAELTADFKVSGTVADNIADTLEGTISGFKDGDSAPLGDLKLMLSGVLSFVAGVADSPDAFLRDDALKVDPPTDDRATNTNLISAKTGAATHRNVGNWEARLFGIDKATNIPTGVAGAFNAEIMNQGVVVGGFGATRPTE